MRFTEYEMTVAVDATARQMHRASRPWRKATKAEAAWQELSALQKYQHRAAAGEMILPALVELPERPTTGATPEFSDAEYDAAAEAGARALVEQREPDSWERMPQRRRRRLVRATAMLTKAAVRAMPTREEAPPEGLAE